MNGLPTFPENTNSEREARYRPDLPTRIRPATIRPAAYYNLNKIDPEITDIFTPSDYLNQDNINQGLVSIERQKLKKDTYDAGNRIYAATC